MPTQPGAAVESLPLQEEPSQGRMTHFRWVILGLVFLGTTINYVDRLVIAILIPDLQVKYGITTAQYGYIGAAFGLAYAFGQLFSGGLLDKIGTRMGYAVALTGWSICAMLTGFGRGALSFGIFRAMLGFTEAPAFPAAAKACAEWFPRRQRAFAFGFVNAGTNMGAILAPAIVPYLANNFGWQWAFILTGAMGFVVLALWLWLYRRPEEHLKISQAELAFIQSDPPEPTGKRVLGILDLHPFSFRKRMDRWTFIGILFFFALLLVGVGPIVRTVYLETRGTAGAAVGTGVLVVASALFLIMVVNSIIQRFNDANHRDDLGPTPDRNMVGYRPAWVFAMGKFITDPMWWFYMTWLPKFLYENYKLDLKTMGLPLIIIYLMSDAGSIIGGWISSTLIKRGYSINMARKTAFILSAVCVVPIIFAQNLPTWLVGMMRNISGSLPTSLQFGPELGAAVLILGLATAGHQGFSSNLYTLCSDLFPKRAVASVAGFGGTFGWIGAGLFQIFVGLWVERVGTYHGPFLVAGLAYLLALVVIHFLSPRLTPAVIDDGTTPPERGFEVLSPKAR